MKSTRLYLLMCTLIIGISPIYSVKADILFHESSCAIDLSKVIIDNPSVNILETDEIKNIIKSSINSILKSESLTDAKEKFLKIDSQEIVFDSTMDSIYSFISKEIKLHLDKDQRHWKYTDQAIRAAYLLEHIYVDLQKVLRQSIPHIKQWSGPQTAKKFETSEFKREFNRQVQLISYKMITSSITSEKSLIEYLNKRTLKFVNTTSIYQRYATIAVAATVGIIYGVSNDSKQRENNE